MHAASRQREGRQMQGLRLGLFGRARRSRHGRRLAFLGVALAALALLGLIGGGTRAPAQVSSTNCLPITGPAPLIGDVTCTFTTTVTVVPGGSLVKAVTSPSPAAITTVTLPASVTGCTVFPASPSLTASVTITCAANGTGIPSGTAITQTFQGVLPGTPITENVTYNANGPIPAGAPGVPATIASLVCTPFSGTGTGSTATCSGATTVAVVPGGTLVEMVALAGGVTGAIAITTCAPAMIGTCAPAMIGTCPLTGATATSITYTCGAAQAIPPLTPLAETITVTSALSAVTAPTKTICQNCSGGATGGLGNVAVPAPTTVGITLTSLPLPSPGASASPSPSASASPSPGSSASPAPIACTLVSAAVNSAVASGATCNSNCLSAPGTTATAPAGGAGAAVTTIATGGPYTGFICQPIRFAIAATPAAGLAITNCSVSFCDGSRSNLLSPTHSHAVSGTYTVTVTVTDNAGVTTSASTTVSVGALGPLCQEPGLNGNSGAVPCITGATCIASSLNNGCRPVCTLTGEVLVPGNCPGPATGNQITINGPYQLQIFQPFSVESNINLPATSDLLPGDSIRFDFGDGTVITNRAPAGTVPLQTNSTAGSGAPGGNAAPAAAPAATGAAPSGSQGGAPAFPADTRATHVYDQPGTYPITVTVTFSNSTNSVAKTTATVTGISPANSLSAMALPPPLQPGLVAVPLASGCNNVTLTFPDGTAVTSVATAVQGASVSSIYELPANAPVLGFFADPSAPSNLVSVRRGDAAVICVRGSGNLIEPVQ
ncbi:MAG: PKD domain-containing protein [Dehalococcoidia bacterium]